MSSKAEKKSKEEILAEMEQADLARIHGIRVVETPEGVVLQGRQINVSDLLVLDPDRLLVRRIIKVDGNFRAEGSFLSNLYQENLKEVTGSIYVSDAARLPCLSVVGGDKSQMEKAYRAYIPEFGITPERQASLEQAALDAALSVDVDDDNTESFACAFEDIPLPDDVPCWMSENDDEGIPTVRQEATQWESAESGVRSVGNPWVDNGQSAKEAAIAFAKKMRESQKTKDRQRYHPSPSPPSASPVTGRSGSLFQNSRPVLDQEPAPVGNFPFEGGDKPPIPGAPEESRLSGDAKPKGVGYKPRNSVFSM